MDEKIFREKSIERVSSPEELNHYIKSTSPKLWVVLAAIIVFLVGVIIWGTVGKIESGSYAGCTVKNGVFECYVAELDYEKIKETPYIRIENVKSELVDTVEGPFQAGKESEDYLFHLSSIGKNSWYIIIKGKIDGVEDGGYQGFVVKESISPIKFVFN